MGIKSIIGSAVLAAAGYYISKQFEGKFGQNIHPNAKPITSNTPNKNAVANEPHYAADRHIL